MFILYQNIWFNYKLAAGKTLQEFIKHEKHHGLTEEQYKEVHDLCVKKEKVERKIDKSDQENP